MAMDVLVQHRETKLWVHQKLGENNGDFGPLSFDIDVSKLNWVIGPVEFAHSGVDFWVLSEWRVAIPARQRVDVSLRHQGDALLRYIGFSDYILFGSFLGISFGLSMYSRLIFMWGVFFIWIVFGPFKYGSFILMCGAIITYSDSFFHR